MTEEQRAQQVEAIDRIRKLLALSQSPNEAEAALAAARVQELLTRHNLTMGVVEDASQQRAEERSTESLGTRVQPHVWVLARACEAMFEVRYYRRQQYVETPGAEWRFAYEKRIVFIGLAANVETAVVTFSYLSGAIDSILKGRLREGSVHGAAEARDYRLGAADRIRRIIISEKQRVIQNADQQSAALIHLSRQIATAAINTLKLKNFSADTFAKHAGAYSLGHTDGGQINPYAARTSRMLTSGTPLRNGMK